jgi:hypothetical protein
MPKLTFRMTLLAVLIAAGCKTTSISPTKLAAIEVDSTDGSTAAPPGPGDVSRRFTADRAKLAKSAFKHLSPGVTSDKDFAIDQDRGPYFFQKSTSVESKIRSLRGSGPGGGRFLVEIRPEGAETLVIVRSDPKVDEAAALVLLDKIEADVKAPAGDVHP